MNKLNVIREKKMEKDSLTLKWGSLKAWDLHSEKCIELLNKWASLGHSESAIAQHDSSEQKTIICQIIDECNADEIYLDWDGKYISKDEAKKYVLEYGSKQD